MKKKVLFCANVDEHIECFHYPYMELFKKNGWQVHVASKGNKKMPFTDKKINWDIKRSPFSKDNINAYNQIKELLYEEKYSLICTHTPNASALVRMAAANLRKEGLKIIYLVHGFHFHKNSSKISWMMYYTIEKRLSKLADKIVTINLQDFNIATKNEFGDVELVHGLGVDANRFYPIEKEEKQKIKSRLNIPSDKTIYVYAANFEPSKNHIFLIDVFHKIKEFKDDFRVYFLGRGYLQESLAKQCKELGLEEHIVFAGYTNEIENWMRCSDFYISSSQREGLGLNLIEALFCGCRTVASDIRGHEDALNFGKNPLARLLPLNQTIWVNELTDIKPISAEKMRSGINMAKVFALENTLKEHAAIYSQVTNEDFVI